MILQDSNVLFSDWKNKNSSQTSPVSTVVSESSISSNLETRPVHPPLSPSEVVEIAKEKKNVSKSYAEHLSKSTAGLLPYKYSFYDLYCVIYRNSKKRSSDRR